MTEKYLAQPDLDFIAQVKGLGGETLKKAGNCVKPGGKIVSITEDPRPHVPQEKNIQCHFVFVEPNVKQLDHIREMVDSGKLKTHLCSVYSLADVQKAHKEMETGHTRGKIVFIAVRVNLLLII